jgi:glutathione S-transferase
MSPYSCRVIWALKFKGIPYEYIEEDLSNKSSLLLHYNPIHKKIPVFVHGGKPICESMIILEYIDKVWPQCPLLPVDPYERAVARFWIKFADEKGIMMWVIYRTIGEEQEKAVNETLAMLETMENHGLGEKTFFGGDEISMVDLAFGQVAFWLGIVEDITSLHIFESHKFPRLIEWAKNFREAPIIRENLPDREKGVTFLKRVWETKYAN